MLPVAPARPCCRQFLRSGRRLLAHTAAASPGVGAGSGPSGGGMAASVLGAVQAIHGSPTKAVVVVAGGGSQGLSWLLSVPGASGTVLEATVPYSRAAMNAFLGSEPPKYVCAETARQMALQAYRRALRLSSPDDAVNVAGVALTAALVTTSPKHGDHACHVATYSVAGSRQYALSLAKTLARDRMAEDKVVSTLLVQALADTCGVRTPPALLTSPLLDKAADESVTVEHVAHSDALGDLLAGRVPVVQLHAGRVTAVGAASPTVLLPGSFNPVHEGHIQLLAAACAAVGPGASGGFELSVTNADKGVLPRHEVERRAQQFESQGYGAEHTLVLTDAPLFVKKARLLPGTVFVVGVDTALRILMPRYYGNSDDTMRGVLKEIMDCGCSFLVAGRLIGDGFVEPTTVTAPPGLEGLFRSLPSFRQDISSSQLRAAMAAAPAVAEITPAAPTMQK